jgi:hypothetical protein
MHLHNGDNICKLLKTIYKLKQSSKYARFIYIDEYKSKVWNIKCIHLLKVSYQKYASDTNVYIKWIK